MIRCPHCSAENADGARFCGACGRATSSTEPTMSSGPPTAARSAPDLAGREIAGRYRVLAKLGEGGMGAVYRGEQISLKRTVAIKLLHPELSANPALVRRFNAEAELAAKLSHPNTVNIYDFGQDSDGTLFIAMEYLEGKSLRAAVSTEGPMPPRRALHIAGQIAASIADAHGHGIVHRDLKPDNVMLTERGKAKDIVRVLDFGIAKLRDENRQTVQPMTQAGDLVGTPQYMAPEQIRGDTVDGRTDVYALGAILYEMLTGRLVFEGASLMAILSRHLLDTPEPPSRRRPDLQLPPGLDDLVLSMLAKDPAHRLPSMDAASERIAAAMLQSGGAPTPSGPMSAPMMIRPPGVPQTLPPGMMQAPPSGAMAPVPLRPPATAPMTMQPPAPMRPMQPAYPMMMQPMQVPMRAAPARGGMPVWGWVLIGVGAIGAVGAAVAVSQTGSDDAKSAQKGSASSTSSSGAPVVPDLSLPGDVVTAGAYRVTLPLGFIPTTAQCPAAGSQDSYTGTLGGDVVTLTIAHSTDDLGNAGLVEYDGACNQLASECFSGGMKASSHLVVGHGTERYRCTILALGVAVDAVIYSGPSGTMAVFFSAKNDAFDRLAAERDAALEARVQGP